MKPKTSQQISLINLVQVLGGFLSCTPFLFHLIQTALKKQFTQKWKISHLLTPLSMESRPKLNFSIKHFCSLTTS